MTLLVNTIEHNGQKAVINSYTHHEALVASRETQRAEWATRYPRATVRTEELSETETRRLVAEGRARGGHLYSPAHAIGQSSL